MKIGMVYDSLTGNTRQVAEEIALAVKRRTKYGEMVVFSSGEAAEKIDVIRSWDMVFIGFWTDKGRCSKKLEPLLGLLDKKLAALFGTAGFGESQEYFEKILNNVGKVIPRQCTVLGGYMCQGRMGMSVRKRYEEMEKNGLPNAESLIENFDKALSHPDNKDLSEAVNFALHMIEKAEEKMQ